MSLILTLYSFAAAGLLASVYALYIKYQHKRDSRYKAVCDLSSKVSCTKVLDSKYSNLLVLPNAVFGVPFYAIILILTAMGRLDAIFLLALIATIGSVYLAYLSFYKLRIVCPICTAIYLINIALLAVTAPVMLS